MPLWAELDYLSIEIDCYLARHGDDHRFSLKCLISLLKMLDDISCDISDSIRMSDDRIDLSVALFCRLDLLRSRSLDLGDKMIDLTHDKLLHLDLHEA